MKKLQILFIVAVTALVFASCVSDALERKSANNSEYDVELLFNIEGHNVYRFRDGDLNYHYIVIGNGETISPKTSGTRKSRHYWDETIQTVSDTSVTFK